MERKRVILLGAAGRDFHNFNVFYRNAKDKEVVAFTATQIPNIEGRLYPPELAGELYPEGIPIYPEEQLEELIKKYNVDEAVFAYSDVTHERVMHLGSRAMAAGADFHILGPNSTMLKSSKPVVAVLATRTGCGKSQVSRYVASTLTKMGKKVVSIRHPMPYGDDLLKQRVERFATYEDLERYECTIEEREEYEAYIEEGLVIYAGVDYEAILREAEKEADIILWDGGNNDLPFVEPNLWITVADPFRAGHEFKYYPGETNFRRADVILVNKANTASKEQVAQVIENAKIANPNAIVIPTASEVTAENSEMIKGKKVLCIEDGPTLTHGEMTFGAGEIAAKKYGAAEIVDPREHFIGSIAKTYETYPHIGKLIPAMGYFPEQIADLEATIKNIDCDVVLVATPVDLGRILKLDKPSLRVRYALAEMDDANPTFHSIIEKFYNDHF